MANDGLMTLSNDPITIASKSEKKKNKQREWNETASDTFICNKNEHKI